jgi:hypothetical protein
MIVCKMNTFQASLQACNPWINTDRVVVSRTPGNLSLPWCRANSRVDQHRPVTKWLVLSVSLSGGCINNPLWFSLIISDNTYLRQSHLDIGVSFDERLAYVRICCTKTILYQWHQQHVMRSVYAKYMELTFISSLYENIYYWVTTSLCVVCVLHS